MINIVTRNNQHYSILVLIASDDTRLGYQFTSQCAYSSIITYSFDKSYILSIYNKSKMIVGPMGRMTNGL